MSGEVILEQDEWKPHLKESVYTNDIYLNKEGKGNWVVGEYECDTQFTLPAYQKEAFDNVCTLLDGKHTIVEIADSTGIHSKEILSILQVLKSKGMLREKYSGTQTRFSEVDNLSIKLINYQFKNHLNSIKNRKIAAVLVKGMHIILLLSILVFVYLNIRNNFAAFNNTTLERWLSFGKSESNQWTGYLLINLGMVLMFVFHELGHVISGVHAGIQPEKFSFVLYLGFIPMFYVKNKNIYSLKKKDFLKVLLAGCYVNIILCIIFLDFYLFTGSEICKTLAMSNLRIFFINLWPLSLSDGYFIFSVLFRHPNLRYKFHYFIAKPKIIKKYNRMEVLYTFLSMFILVLTMSFEVTWFIGLFNISEQLKVVIVSAILCTYIIVLHFLNKRKFEINPYGSATVGVQS
ncbi:hypothetical protein acsn021_07640 [Anaerocolumna cellulosilytica]|uniref:Uncharacterized protein n=1 Tax=Anaerocolumna cellulosilytica TaxID=433286 RepID=A0A6S6R0S4_9FIRM|nr:M50 family metallopeptidase [Anaerocolumna cellulosilytica]MBB5197620.1 hypothetical protein [Anaerocolumna cellulosilytica]BCJ93195.1 hypothetical protein acsn021_07640 [Anaerocolumna cellulosilytica]